MNKYQESYHFSTFDDKNYLPALIILGFFTLIFLSVGVCLFSTKFLVLGIIVCLIGLFSVFLIVFCSVMYAQNLKEKKKQKNGVVNEKHL